MRKIFTSIHLFILFCLAVTTVSGQVYTNKGTDFWVGYQRTNGFSQGNSQEMVIYMAAGSQAANVTIQITGTSTPWVKNYVVPANSAIQSDFIPKTGANNATLTTAGFHDNQAIHITSDVPIVAYAHIYESANSGATMLMPSSVWGFEYYTINNRQNYSPAGGVPSATVFHVIAKEDSTWVEINPSRPTSTGWVSSGGTQPNGNYLVKLNKGDVYQVLGGVFSGAEGQDLTGSLVKSIPNAQGATHPIAVFSGSTRTSFGCGNTLGSSGDLIIQQVFPYELWGTKYATAPFSNFTGLSSLMTSIYRIMVKDITTIVKRNGVVLSPLSLINGSYYQFESSTADHITSDKPILVAQYMSSAGACPTVDGSKADPEMILLTPSTGAIAQASFYRNNKQDITGTFLTIVIPSSGIPSLKIDGVLFSNITPTDKYFYTHPNLPGYTVVTKRYPAGSGQSYVESNYAFTGYTYGVGTVESYGYNVGIQIDSANLQTIKYNTIQGSVFLDHNKNGIKETGEPLYPYVKMHTMRTGIDTFNTYTSSGNFIMYVDSGSYITTPTPFSPYYVTVPAADTSYFPSYFDTATLTFAVQPVGSVRDLAITMVPVTPARPGFDANYKLLYVNKGTDTADAVISLAKNNNLSFISSSLTPASITADTIKWNIASVFPGTAGAISLKLNLAVPPALNNGDTLRYKAIISSAKIDSTPVDNISSLAQRITNSYDPNDKTESHGNYVLKSALNNGELLNYTIRFQNTGSDTAFNIVIRDTLDARLDWNTLKMVDASHSYQLVVNEGRCAWSFNNIQLVDSNKNEPLSHGYLSFNIQARNTANVGDVISNKAAIYFDHNLPIVTNTASTTVAQEVLPVTLTDFIATKKTDHNLLEWHTATEVNLSHFEVERSENANEFHLIGKVNAGASSYTFADNSFARTVNFYRLKMVDKDNKFRYSAVRKINNGSGVDISIYPNPAKDVVYLRTETVTSTTLGVGLYSADGRMIKTQKLFAGSGISTLPVDIQALQPGIHLLKVDVQGDTPVIFKFHKQ